MGANSTENGLLEGISSLHSWIKSQTMIKPAGREKETKSGIIRTNYEDEVEIRIHSLYAGIYSRFIEVKNNCCHSLEFIFI